jgi:uncharacterized protein YecE (DUF72 family)
MAPYSSLQLSALVQRQPDGVKVAIFDCILKRDPARGVITAFLDRLDVFFAKAPQAFLYTIETRNPNDLQEGFFDFLRSCHLGFVLPDGSYMPPTSAVAGGYNIRTADFSVIRLHGPDRAKIEEQPGGDWSQIVEPKDAGLEAAANLLHANTEPGVATYVNVNNHCEGNAPLTIQRLVGLL